MEGAVGELVGMPPRSQHSKPVSRAGAAHQNEEARRIGGQLGRQGCLAPLRQHADAMNRLRACRVVVQNLGGVPRRPGGGGMRARRSTAMSPQERSEGAPILPAVPLAPKQGLGRGWGFCARRHRATGRRQGAPRGAVRPWRRRPTGSPPGRPRSIPPAAPPASPSWVAWGERHPHQRNHRLCGAPGRDEG